MESDFSPRCTMMGQEAADTNCSTGDSHYIREFLFFFPWGMQKTCGFSVLTDIQGSRLRQTAPNKLMQLRVWSCLERGYCWDLPSQTDPCFWVPLRCPMIIWVLHLAVKLFYLISLSLTASDSVFKDVCNTQSSCSISWGSVISSKFIPAESAGCI